VFLISRARRAVGAPSLRKVDPAVETQRTDGDIADGSGCECRCGAYEVHRKFSHHELLHQYRSAVSG